MFSIAEWITANMPKPSVADMNRAAAQFDEVKRLARITASWEAYYGRLPDPLKVKPKQINDNVKLNYGRLIVNTGAAYLFGKDLRFEAPGEKANTWLQQCWTANRQMTTLTRLGINGGVAGHALVQLKQGAKFPRTILLDPQQVTVDVDPEDYERVVQWTKEWRGNDPLTRKEMIRRQRIVRSDEHWDIIDERSLGDNPRFEEIGRSVWPYEWSPIFGCQNQPAPNEYWGVSDLEEDVLAVNHSLNFLLSNLARIIRFHAHPKIWGRGFNADQLKSAVDEITILPSATSELKSLEMASDLASSVELYNRLTEALHKLTFIPEVATGKLESVGNLSGLALQILYRPLTDLTETKRSFYGEMLADLNTRLLELGGIGTGVMVKTHWQEMLPRDAKTEAETAIVRQQAGVSKATTLSEMGYDPEDEEAKRTAEASAEQDLGDKLLDDLARGQADA